MATHLVLIDALNLIRRIYAVQERPFANMMSSSQLSSSPELSQNTIDQILNNTQSACTNALHKILATLNPTHALAVFDSSEPCWRYDVYPDYKKGRQKMPVHLEHKLTDIQDAFMLQYVDSLIP